mmetsp:Transcript_110022/g.306592  ORF Transcript_110022/g.306592 Transcript_110022/m.306592 type:complete len:241 (+) Transcript_110022:548-1270(+)
MVRKRCSLQKSPCNIDTQGPSAERCGALISLALPGDFPLVRATTCRVLIASASRPCIQRKRGDSGRSRRSHAVAKIPGTTASARACQGHARTAKAIATSTKTPAFHAKPSICLARARYFGGEYSATSGYKTLKVPTAPTDVSMRAARTAQKDGDRKVSTSPTRCTRLKSTSAARRPRASATTPESRKPIRPPMNHKELRSCCCTKERFHCAPRAGDRNAAKRLSMPTKAYTRATFTASLV